MDLLPNASSGKFGEQVGFRLFKSRLVIWESTLSGLLGGILCSRKSVLFVPPRSTYRTRAIRLPAHGAEVAGISDKHMKDLRASARLCERCFGQRSLAAEISGSRTHGSWRAFWRPSGCC
eukprot:2539286-Amphidinium_carterae.1